MSGGRARVVLLDFDGTVVDTMSVYARWVGETLGPLLGLEAEEVARRYLEMAGMPFVEQARLMGIPDDRVQEVVSGFVEFKRSVLKSLDVNECVRKFVEGLAERGYIVALSTNNECESVSYSPAITCFHLVLCFDGVWHRKGAPHLETLRRLFGDDVQVVFIGDSEYDMRVYSDLGIPTLRTKGLFDCSEAERVKKGLVSLDDPRHGKP